MEHVQKHVDTMNTMEPLTLSKDRDQLWKQIEEICGGEIKTTYIFI
jgi:hypothetical protein